MGKQKQVSIGIFAGCVMLIMILDTKTAFSGAVDGMQLCIRTIIPSLFPFIFLSGMINSSLYGCSVGFLRPICKLCKIPKGGESILLLGLLAGYPVGAQTIAQTYKEGNLSLGSAKRMLGFCNNAGPAFLFGILSGQFSKTIIPWILWGIHIFSALVVGCILPWEDNLDCKINKKEHISVHKILQNTIHSISVICGWIILFRIIIAFLEEWILWLLPIEIRVLISGLLELSNGCVLLQNVSSEAIRFLLASCMIAFGGFCVGMQTKSVTQEVGCGMYFPGKVLQMLFSILISMLLLPVLYADAYTNSTFLLAIPLFTIIFLFLLILHRKKVWHLWESCCIIWKTSGGKEQNNAFP